ncbi:hypothetical protein BB560_000040 [Smittium megazygosporum]|uniref:phosphoribosylglycinamide formyltransferase 1 n=1 Tax=Smittium megazygosporum TaxID=133381 RepID=A0A2T9ZLP9_9FUNG|nr:hypothetical protein BB560_000040 [Smittium megazygosporum]
MSKRIVVLISGNGSNLQSLIDKTKSHEIPGTIVHVFSSKSTAYGLERAKAASIPTSVLSLKTYKDKHLTREDFNKDLSALVSDQKPDLVVLAGWMLILSESFVNQFRGKLINLHPSMPGDIEGANAIERAYQEFLSGKRTKTGVMVHYVIPEVDKGEPILFEKVDILPNDSLNDLETRIHTVEHKLISLAVAKVLSD